MTEQQIGEIERRGVASDHVTLTAPMGGVVIEKQVQEGMYIETGSRIYTIADMSRLWVMFDVYERDLSWVRYGQSVRFTTAAYPGRAFEGTVAFIDPVLDDVKRTVKVRVNVGKRRRAAKTGDVRAGGGQGGGDGRGRGDRSGAGGEVDQPDASGDC